MPDVQPITWKLGRQTVAKAGLSPIFYTAPGGWIITNEPDPHAPDRPWVLRRHGQFVARCHTLRIAKYNAATAPERSPR